MPTMQYTQCIIHIKNYYKLYYNELIPNLYFILFKKKLKLQFSAT